MPSGQQFLFEPEKPLVQRLGTHFFKQLPRRPGVYRMRDAQGQIVYVGKAKDLRQRLSSYRVANPERMGRRHLRLLQQVTTIEFDLCASESTALKHEAKLIRELRPRFNRAGVWQGKPQFLVWRFSGQAVEFSVQEIPQTGWERYGSLGAYAPRLRAVLVRLIWLMADPARGCTQMQLGWMQNRMAEVVEIPCATAELQPMLTEAFWGTAAVFLTWLDAKLKAERSAFERAAIQRDWEELQEFFERDSARQKSAQLALL